MKSACGGISHKVAGPVSGLSIVACGNKAVFLVASKDMALAPWTQLGGVGGGNIVPESAEDKVTWAPAKVMHAGKQSAYHQISCCCVNVWFCGLAPCNFQKYFASGGRLRSQETERLKTRHKPTKITANNPICGCPVRRRRSRTSSLRGTGGRNFSQRARRPQVPTPLKVEDMGAGAASRRCVFCFPAVRPRNR